MSWLYACLKLLLIIASAFFAALALLTKYKDDTGRITRSGKIALWGIVGTAAISVTLSVLDVSAASEAARKAKTDADAVAQRLLTPLGPMRLRIRLRVPSAQFTSFRDRVVSQNSGWRQSYAMPIGDQDGPRNSSEETRARNFFGRIMIAASVHDAKQPPPQGPPIFGKLLIYGLPTLGIHLPQSGGDPPLQDSPDTVQLFYDHASDSFLLELQTPYFDDYDTSGQFLSFRDFPDKSLRLAFNVQERGVAYVVDFVEIQSRNGKRRIWIENFKEESPGSDTFVAVIPPTALLD